MPGTNLRSEGLEKKKRKEKSRLGVFWGRLAVRIQRGLLGTPGVPILGTERTLQLEFCFIHSFIYQFSLTAY